VPYKRPGSPFYQIRRRSLQGYGDTGVLTTKTEKKRIARRMEDLLEEIAERALLEPKWADLLDAVCEERTVKLPELLQAKNEGRLEALCRQLHDPLLHEAIETYREEGRVTRQTENGLSWLEDNTPSSMRLSDLDAQTIMGLLRDAEKEGRKRNSVRRYQMRAISLVLRHHLGDAERDRVFSGVTFEPEDDTREVHLLPKEIRGLLDACHQIGRPLYEELAVVIRLALQTSADRGVLLAGSRPDGEARGLLVRDVRIYHDQDTGEYSGEVFLHDQKTKERSRAVPLTDSLARELLALANNKGPDEPVFEMSYNQLDYRWQKVRAMADLEHVRFKDLRAQTAQYGEMAGVDQTTLKETMGHSDESMTRRYQQRSASMSQEQARALEAEMLDTSDE
jgi:integrase